MQSLPVFLNLACRPIIVLGEGEAAEAKRRLVARAGGIATGEESDARLAIVALGDPEAAVARLRARGILVNAVDRPDLCDFTLPAIVDRDPVLIAIGTAGRSAGLAKALRQRFEALLPARLGALAEALYAARPAIRRRWPDAADRRRAIDAALEAGEPLDPFAEPGDVAGWLTRVSPRAESGLVAIALTSPDPDDLTLRAARLLGRADRVFHAPDVPESILARARADAVRVATAAAPAATPSGLSLWLNFTR